MTDVFTKKKRSEVMSKIRSKKTKPELILRELIDGRVFKYQPPGITGKPDFASKKHRITIFVDGCFWHSCPKCYIEPATNKKFWLKKIEANRKRDHKVNRLLKKEGFSVLRFWEHQIEKNPKRIAAKIEYLCLGKKHRT